MTSIAIVVLPPAAVLHADLLKLWHYPVDKDLPGRAGTEALDEVRAAMAGQVCQPTKEKALEQQPLVDWKPVVGESNIDELL